MEFMKIMNFTIVCNSKDRMPQSESTTPLGMPEDDPARGGKAMFTTRRTEDRVLLDRR